MFFECGFYHSLVKNFYESKLMRVKIWCRIMTSMISAHCNWESVITLCEYKNPNTCICAIIWLQELFITFKCQEFFFFFKLFYFTSIEKQVFTTYTNYTPAKTMFSRVYWNQPVSPSMRLSVYKILLSVKALAGGAVCYQVTFSDSSSFCKFCFFETVPALVPSVLAQ